MDVISQTSGFRQTLESEASSYGVDLTPETRDELTGYYQLLCSWNSRLHLVAPTTPEEFATRHILESLLLLEYLPKEARVADIGSGGGLPIIPCLIVQPNIRATLIESSKKKAVFLREALRQIGHSNSAVVAERFESVVVPEMDFVTCRAVERFEKILPQMIEWAPSNATLLLFGGPGLESVIATMGLSFEAKLIQGSERRLLYRVKR